MREQRKFFGWSCLVGGISLIWLLTIPSDPENVWWLGYSKARLSMALGLGLLELILFVGLIGAWKRLSAVQSLSKKLDGLARNAQVLRISFLATGFGVFGSAVFVALWVIFSNKYGAYFLRLAPGVVFIGFICTYLFLWTKSLSRNSAEVAPTPPKYQAWEPGQLIYG